MDHELNSSGAMRLTFLLLSEISQELRDGVVEIVKSGTDVHEPKNCENLVP